LVTQGRKPVFASAEAVEVLRKVFRKVRQSRPFEIDAMVVMPDQLHCIWTLPPGDADFSTRWRLIKTWFTKHCDSVLRLRPTFYVNPGMSRQFGNTVIESTSNAMKTILHFMSIASTTIQSNMV
jgi:REP element-mobilizing transposase RayT